MSCIVHVAVAVIVLVWQSRSDYLYVCIIVITSSTTHTYYITAPMYILLYSTPPLNLVETPTPLCSSSS